MATPLVCLAARALLSAALLVGAAAPAVAQLLPGRLPEAFPPLGLPQQLPVPAPRPGDVANATVGAVDGAVRNTTSALPPVDVRLLRELRSLELRDLLRRHREVLERDPRGAPVLRSVLVSLSPSDAAVQAAQAAGFTVLQERALEAFGGRIVNLLAPRGLDTRRALAQLRRLDPQGTYDFNHIYIESAAATESSAVAATQSAAHAPTAPDLARTPLVPAAAPAGTQDARAPRVGLIDGGVQAAHPAFAGVRMHSFGCNGSVVPGAHGTAVASLLVGQAGAFRGAAPGFELYAADVYCGGEGAVGGLVDWIGAALAWMARENVPVVNVSLVGPPNVVLEGVLKLAQGHGMVIVAAVGNDGPAAKPLYPAAYPGVVGVTAVDREDRVLLEACRGPQVDFAAPGAQMAAATGALGYAEVRGTSFAAPLVAGLIARTLARPGIAAAPGGAIETAIETIAAAARDLGAKGPDTIYGRGLVGAELRVALAAATSTN